MLKAVLRNGLIYPAEPVPPEWEDGTEVQVEKIALPVADPAAPSTTDQWMDEVERLAARGDPESDRQLNQAIADIRQQVKDLARQGKR